MRGQTIQGSVQDGDTGIPLVGAQIRIANTQVGTYSDAKGTFRLKTSRKFPLVLQVTYIGYDTLMREVKNASRRVRLSMVPRNVEVDEVQITAQRRSELQEKLNLTIESLNISAIQNTTESSFYESLATLREVDLLTVSFGVKVVNTRGFNSSAPVRSLQLIDGVDNASPGLNYPLGNFIGLSELDVEGVDLVIGASSAFFGAGAFNGVINMRTKSPFLHQGLQAMVKVGERDFREGAIRFAKAFTNKAGEQKWAFKLNASYTEIYDWEANDISPSIGSLRDSVYADNPGGYDAVNRYGDEVSSNFTSLFEQFRHPGLGRYYRTGYMEKDLADYDSDNIKLGAALHFRPGRDWEIIWGGNYGGGTTVMQLDNRLSLKNVWALQNKLEIRKPNKFFFRAYMTEENAGDTYDIVTTAYLLQGKWKSDGNWLQDYQKYWFRNMNEKVKGLEGFPTLGPAPDFFYDFDLANQIMVENRDSLTLWHQQVRNIQDQAYLQPGTPEYEELFQEIISTPVSEGGTKYIDQSRLYHMHGEYKFQTPTVGEITLGGSYRLYKPYSEGTIFSDTSGVDITVHEFGAYLGVEKKLVDERLRLNATVRLDKSKHYDPLISPTASLSYQFHTQHQVRISLSSALRNPTLIEQHYYFRIGNAILLGNLNGYKNLITQDSFEEYIESTNLDTTLLVRFDEDKLKPEKALAGEVAYNGIWFNNRLSVDATYYLNRYRDFIGYKIGLQVPFFMGFPGTPRIYRFSANAKDVTITTGFSLSLDYFLSNTFSLGGNYSWNKIVLVSDDPLIPAYNTPEHKFNVNFSGNNMKIGNTRNWNFGISFRWVEGYTFESSPQFTGEIPSQYFLNAQVGKTFPKINSLIKIAGSNLLNRQQNGLYGGPNVGRFVYIAYGFQWK